MLDGGYWLTKHDSAEALYAWLNAGPSIVTGDRTLHINPNDVIQVIEEDAPKWDHAPSNWARYFPPVSK